ncbi:hypothetical protein HGO97_023170 [Faecalicatena sp. AGMB00832]|uniref:Glycosyl transferase family 2 n=1 Tax=Faecalicatena faecalis TaxID=2726362 RepID=A0ABS6DAM9_9FIRM|nr:hypothetical protein [Faecalicatena faecalis]MBU3878702.1 hypothetical protein [Faecalicatena faecalis]
MLLLITGCINVNPNTPYVTISDMKDRLNSYKETVRWAIEESTFDKIVFCENSAYPFDMGTFQSIAKKKCKKIEYLTFQGNTSQVIKHGKGYGEGEIIEYAIKKSVLLQHENAFCKITGRLKVKNTFELVCDVNKNYFMNKKYLPQVDTRFYYVQKKIFSEYLLKQYLRVNDYEEYYLENVYYDVLRSNKIQYSCFSHRPLFKGVGGSNGTNYDDRKTKLEIIYNVLCKTNLYNSTTFWRFGHKIKNLYRNIVK